MSADLTVRSSWLSYMDLVIPKDAPPIQIQESKRAFFAGAMAVLEMSKRVGEPDISEDLGVEIFQRLDEELAAYRAELGKTE